MTNLQKSTNRNRQLFNLIKLVVEILVAKLLTSDKQKQCYEESEVSTLAGKIKFS